jgi:hypothetical protein
MALGQDITQFTALDVCCDLTIDRAINMETVFGLVLVITILRTDSVINWFVCISKNNNLKAICFKVLREVFNINHSLFMGAYLISCRLISILRPVLLLECHCVTHVAIVTNTVDCDYCKLFVILAKTDVTPSSVPSRIFSGSYDASSPVS